MKKPLIVLTGPTAVGKTALSIALAKQLGCEIISADSMQIYKYMDIGSAKIMPQEMEGVPHYLVDVLKPEEEFHVVRFQQMAKEAMEQIYAHGNIPLLVGGTGFYIQAVTRDIDFTEGEEDRVYRSSLEEIAKTKGPEILHQRLQEIDPPSAASIHANNIKRVIRALEFYHLNGYPISRHNQQESEKESPYNLAYFVLNDERSHLYERIDKRVDLMMESGLVEEVCRLKAMGYDRSMVSMQGLGYKELLAWMDGEFSLDEAVRILKRDTRHFAKRQITWFKREKDVIWMNKPDYDYDDKKILAEMKQICKERGIY
ncbi:MAG: tRNA (adenosine(37)-N6)-dimethylallyltransferase MiaA [Lachnospiraceae bacterium]|nr:tRNA (adenosine(37)-N6)-dimethylallyltransferase MiaA [Lachnospiraceae bacterium]